MTTLASPPELYQPLRNIPKTDDVASLPKEDRKDADKFAEFIWRQYQDGISVREHHNISWIKVLSIMSGVHWFTLAGGQYRKIAMDDGEIRATTPHMESMYRRQMGRLATNRLGVTVTPTIGHDAMACYRAEQAQYSMEHWIHETDMHEVQDEWNQHLCFFGMSGLYRYADKFREQVFVQPIPAPELFPIPFDAPNWRQADGIMRVAMVSKAWMEKEDEKLERARKASGNKQPIRRMAEASKGYDQSLSFDFIHRGGSSARGGKMDGGLAIWIWMKPSELAPQGEQALLINNELFRYDPFLPGGKIPIEPIYYDKRPHDFLGWGFCESLIAPQLEMNLQVTAQVRASVYNKGWLIFDQQQLKIEDLQNSDMPLVPWDSLGSIDPTKPPVVKIEGLGVSKEVVSTIGMVEHFGRMAAGFDSDLVFGQQEGRTESGTATQALAQRADAPIQPVLDRTFRCLTKTYHGVLAMLKEVWPKEKKIRVVGEHNMAKEIMLDRDQLPGDDQVVLTPTPLLAGGRQSMVQMLWMLRQAGNENRTAPMISDSDFFKSMSLLGYSIPGLSLSSLPEMRMRLKVGQIIKGERPIFIRGQDDLEEHKRFMDILRDTILDPAFFLYDEEVQKRVTQAFQAHNAYTGVGAIPPNDFDQAIAKTDGNMLENALDFQNLSLDNFDGTFSQGGMPVGLAV